MLNKQTDARYLQIVNVLKARIVSGLYPVGTLLPTEADFCAEFAVSRYTVREALRRLIALGLISRKQGAGTYVERSEAKEGYFFALRSLTELFQYALDTSFKVVGIDEITLNAAIAAEVGGKARGALDSGDRTALAVPGSAAILFHKIIYPEPACLDCA